MLLDDELFFRCGKIISFRDDNNVLHKSIIGLHLNTGNPLFGTTYIKPYEEGIERLFIPYNNVICPAISISFDNGRVIMPLASCNETD